MANGDNSGFDRDGFLQGGTPFDWKRELDTIFNSIENKTAKILALLESIRELLKKDAMTERGGGKPKGNSRNNGTQGQIQPISPPTDSPIPPVDVTVTVQQETDVRPPTRAPSGSGVSRLRDELGRFMGAGSQDVGSPPSPTNTPPAPMPPIGNQGTDNTPPIGNPPPDTSRQNRGGGGDIPPSPTDTGIPPSRQRDSRGRFVGGGDSGGVPTGQSDADNSRDSPQNRERDSNGRFLGGTKSFFERITDRIGGFFGTINASLMGNVDNLDPLISAAQETANITKAIFKPISLVFSGGKALFNMFRPKRNAESIAWFKKLFLQLRGIRQDSRNNRGGANGGGDTREDSGGSVGGMMLLRFILPFLLPLMLIVAAGLGLAFGGAKLFEYMKDKFGGWIDGLKSSDFGKFIIESWTSLVDGVSKKIGVTVKFFKDVKDTVKGTYDMAVQNTRDTIENTANILSNAKKTIKGTYDMAVENTTESMAYVADKFKSPKTKQKENQLMVHDSFINAGFNKEQAKALTAEVGRENDYTDDFMYGKHGDAANAKTNQGVFSWQGERKEKLVKFMQSKGLVDDSGAFKKGQESLNAQAQFAKMELDSGQYKTGEFNNSNAKAESMAKGLGKGYVKWAYGQDTLSNGNSFDWRKHDAKRRNHLSNLEKQLSNITNTTTEADKTAPLPPLLSTKAPAPLKSNIGSPANFSPLIARMPSISLPSSSANATPMIYRAAPMSKPTMPKTQPMPMVDEKVAVNTQQPIQVIARVDSGYVGQDIANRSLAHVVTGGLSKP